MFLFACLHCSLNNLACSGSKKSPMLFHVTRVYIHTGVCKVGCVYISAAQKPTNTSGWMSPRVRLTWENTERLIRFLVKQFVFTHSVLHHLTHISAKARLLFFFVMSQGTNRDKQRQQRRFSNTAVMTEHREKQSLQLQKSIVNLIRLMHSFILDHCGGEERNSYLTAVQGQSLWPQPLINKSPRLKGEYLSP